METKYETIKRAFRKAKKHWDNHPLSNSAKAEYLEAKKAMLDYYNDVIYPIIEKQT